MSGSLPLGSWVTHRMMGFWSPATSQTGQAAHLTVLPGFAVNYLHCGVGRVDEDREHCKWVSGKSSRQQGPPGLQNPQKSTRGALSGFGAITDQDLDLETCKPRKKQRVLHCRLQPWAVEDEYRVMQRPACSGVYGQASDRAPCPL